MGKSMIIKIQRYEAPCGEMVIGEMEGQLCLCDWDTENHRKVIERRLCRELGSRYEENTSEVIERAREQLDEYFNGKRREFDVPLLLIGTEFQKCVWRELQNIPYGKTHTDSWHIRLEEQGLCVRWQMLVG